MKKKKLKKIAFQKVADIPEGVSWGGDGYYLRVCFQYIIVGNYECHLVKVGHESASAYAGGGGCVCVCVGGGGFGGVAGANAPTCFCKKVGKKLFAPERAGAANAHIRPICRKMSTNKRMLTIKLYNFFAPANPKCNPDRMGT